MFKVILYINKSCLICQIVRKREMVEGRRETKKESKLLKVFFIYLLPFTFYRLFIQKDLSPDENALSFLD